MFPHRWCRRVLPLAAALAVAGCASSSSPNRQASPEYNVIRLYNDSPGDIYELELRAGGTITAFERLPAEHSPVSDRGVSPDPETVDLSWRTAQGTRFEREVEVARDLPPGFRGVIVIRMREDGDVDVQFVRYEDLR